MSTVAGCLYMQTMPSVMRPALTVRRASPMSHRLVASAALSPIARAKQAAARCRPAWFGRSARAGHLRDGAAAGADLPRARHDLHRRRDADRRRRHGRDRRADARADQAAADLGPDAAGGRIDRQAVRLRRLHPDRRARVLADLLRRRRPPLGRGTAGLAARRPGRLPDLRQRLRVRARLLPRLLRDRLHRHPAARRPRRSGSASI